MKNFRRSGLAELLDHLPAAPQSRCHLLAVAELDEDPVNDAIYQEHEEEDAALTADIALHGLMQPLAVRRHPQLPNRYIVVAGHRRLKALKRLGQEWAECYLHEQSEAGDEILSQLALVSTNARQRRRTALEQIREQNYIERLLERLEGERPERYREILAQAGVPDRRSLMAKLLGTSVRSVSHYKSVDRYLDQEEKQALEQGQMSYKESEALIAKRRLAERSQVVAAGRAEDEASAVEQTQEERELKTGPQDQQASLITLVVEQARRAGYLEVLQLIVKHGLLSEGIWSLFWCAIKKQLEGKPGMQGAALDLSALATQLAAWED